jgi:hypothetical protein
MVTSVEIFANHTNTDATRVAQPANFVQMDLANDKLIFSAGSAAVADGQPTPSSAELNEAATIIQAVPVEIAHTFLLDVSDVGQELKEMFMANSGNHRYVICLAFDGATASEPTLEAWDDDGHTTANLNCLGLGTPANSMLKAVLTTGGAPGASWVGTPIAGGAVPNVLLLNSGGGALPGATDVYVNIHWDVPGSYLSSFVESPVVAIRYTYV